MNRRAFLAGLFAASTNPVHFLAPIGGWRRTEGGLWDICSGGAPGPRVKIYASEAEVRADFGGYSYAFLVAELERQTPVTIEAR